MSLKKILLGGMAFVCLNSFSQEGKLNVYSDVANFLGLRPSIGSVEYGKDFIDASFLLGAYNVKMENINDSVYREVITRKFPLKRSKEMFFYLKKEGAYHFVAYSVPYGDRRSEKDSLLNNKAVFFCDSPIDVMGKLVGEGLEGRVNFFILANDISVDVGRRKKDNSFVYCANLNNAVKRKDVDSILFDSDVCIYVVDDKIEKFLTSFSSGKDSDKHYIEGVSD